MANTEQRRTQCVQKCNNVFLPIFLQVEEVVGNCSICAYDDSKAKEICDKYYCKSVNTTTIVSDVKLPLATVDHVIANDCQGKCVIDDEDLKKQICEDNKCKQKSASTIATDISYPEQALNDVISNCDTILPNCPGIDEATKAEVILFGCVYKVPASTIASTFGLAEEQVQAILDEVSPHSVIIRSMTIYCKVLRKNFRSNLS